MQQLTAGSRSNRILNWIRFDRNRFHFCCISMYLQWRGMAIYNVQNKEFDSISLITSHWQQFWTEKNERKLYFSRKKWAKQREAIADCSVVNNVKRKKKHQQSYSNTQHAYYVWICITKKKQKQWAKQRTKECKHMYNVQCTCLSMAIGRPSSSHKMIFSSRNNG